MGSFAKSFTMARSKFSHLARLTPNDIVRAIESGPPPTDEMILKALQAINPRLLGRPMMAALKNELDPKAERRGRPSKHNKSGSQLAADLQSLPPGDLPQPFLDALVTRLESGKRFTDAERGQRAHRRYKRIFKGMLASGLYYEVRQLTEPETTRVVHPVFGEFAVDTELKSRREKALDITAMILRRIEQGGNLSIEGLRNFISEFNTGKTHKIS